MIYDMVVSRTLSVLHRNVSKHSSIKITAASQGILSKNLYGISWCLSLVTLYIWTLTGHSPASDSISHYSRGQLKLTTLASALVNSILFYTFQTVKPRSLAKQWPIFN